MFVPILHAMRLILALALLLGGPAQAQQFRPWTEGATPPLALQDLDGRSHRLDDYRGKVVLVNFWATWCEPCREEMPSINRLRASLAGQPFAVLAVNLAESEARIRRFMEQVPLEFTVLLDRDSGAARAWRARVLPVSFVVGPDGRIRYWALGEIDWTQERVRKAIAALLPPAKTAKPKRGQYELDGKLVTALGIRQ
jgi:thiol-disulfide isomerase/thioredoxin